MKFGSDMERILDIIYVTATGITVNTITHAAPAARR